MTTPTTTQQDGLAPLLEPTNDNNNDKATSPPVEDDDLMAALVAEHHQRRQADEVPLVTQTAKQAVTAEHMEEGRHNDQVPLYNPVASFEAAALTPTEGVWKDSTRDWCVLICVTLWCPIVALGQVMTRLRLDWLARPLPPTETKYSTCFVVTCIVALPWLLHMVSLTFMFREQQQQDGGNTNDNTNGDGGNSKDPFQDIINIHFGNVSVNPLESWHSPLITLFGIVIAVWQFYILCQTRRALRRRDNIREEVCCVGWEDCCCACCCPQLAIYQMSRHTGDFATQRAVCCHATGLVGRPQRQLPPLLV